jgi:MFS transporter, putative metabolite:H+ symporter
MAVKNGSTNNRASDVLSDRNPNELSAAQIVARIERMPMTGFHIRARVVVGMATFFDALDALSIAYVMPVLAPLWQLAPAQVGALISIGFIGQIFGSVLFGWVAERAGRMAALTWSVVIFSIFSALCAFAGDYNSLFILRALQGIGLGGEVPVAAAYINEISKAHGRGFFVMIYEFAFNVGLFFAALLGVLIVPTLGWRVMFLVGAVPAVLVIIMRRDLPESPRWLANRGRLEQANQVVGWIENQVRQSGKELPPIVIRPVAERKSDWRELFQGIYRRRTLVVWVMWVATYFVTYGLMTWTPTLYSTVFKLSLQESLLLPLLTLLISVSTGLVVAILIDRTGRRVWFAGAFLLTAIPLLILWLLGAGSVSLVWWFVTIGAWFIATNAGTLYLYTPELYPTRMRAFGSSLASVWVRIASAIGPIVTGLIVAQYSLATVFLVMGIVPLVGAVVTWLFAVESGNQVLEEISP